MDPSNPESAGPRPKSPEDVSRKGSVKRARQMLQAGKRPEKAQAPIPKPPPFRVDPAHMTQWPLPDTRVLPANLAHPQATLHVPKGPPPKRPPRPDCPSPSVYSERSVSDATAPSPLNIKRPVPSFSQPFPLQQGQRPTIRIPIPRPPSPESVAGSTPRLSVTTDELFRRSGVSSVGTFSSITELPSVPIEYRAPSAIAPKKAASLAPPAPQNRGSVSPIPEEIPDSPTISKTHYSSDRGYPPSWCSGPAESSILGTYLDADSDEDDSVHMAQGGVVTLARQASVGTRGKPALRTIMKSNASSPVPPAERTPISARPMTAGTMNTEAALKEIAIAANRRASIGSNSTASSHFDLEKTSIILDIGTPTAESAHPYSDVGPLEKEIGAAALPKAAPTMSDKRPGARRPPRLNMGAVRDAEIRGSLTSLPDLIRRATKLASNLEHGRTASRNDLLNGPRYPFNDPRRKSGSIKSILASFPPPAATPEGGHSSWPFFLRRSTLHQIQSNDQPPAQDAADQEKAAPKQPRRCCGLPPWLFGLICVIIVIIILAAILIPVCLVVLRHKSSGSNCASTNPCENGGVSVSSGDVCSCVCANGYTGSSCTVDGDASCVTSEVDSKEATMGSDLPDLFEYSQSNFSISLDALTIMALFSQSNVSCTTENALVSFSGVSTKSSSSSSSKSRRDAEPSISDYLLANLAQVPDPTVDDSTHTFVLAARDSVETTNGIVFDSSPPAKTGSPTATAVHETVATEAASTSTATVASTSSSTDSSSSSSSSSASSSSNSTTTVTTTDLNFARVAVLYILQETGTLTASEYSESSIQTYLNDEFSGESTHSFTIDLTPAGIIGNYTLDFDDYEITLPSGSVVGKDG
ncbi:hypothetical protein BO70DRAFT_291869 [Aspergillus heteromorphus CBS 117.55]|uniref:EGF-like domain-containing protein n=1 Tax=Aspergillus heteromorphus CBS 117.55 TaxID=1448321 RepID=A0A317W8K6_9EURO|nr:uncharacterized protein BO70DRAFT_291869 [Aspergillus heteromorphus CBS 117.55]PWY82235.1 hypothetical protein BO70DRAFT_291869 [Aspergillus heteromorphus CBS 117.55]